MSDIFAEVDEVMRQERMKKIWDDYGRFIIGFLVGIILLTAAVSFYHSWDHAQKEEQTRKLNVLLEAENFPQNVTLETLDLKGDVKAMALMGTAAALLDQDEANREKALSFYEEIIADNAVSERVNGLARLMLARLNAADNTDQSIATLEELYNNEDSIWRYHAALELAVLQADYKQDYAKAQDYLGFVLESKTAPGGLLTRADSLRHVYTLRQNQAQ